MSIEWNSKYETNISEIDTQHRKLFELLNNLETLYLKNKGKLTENTKEIKKAISDLEQYTLSHFLIEERIMEDNDYPNLEDHKIQHNKFTEKINDLKNKLFHDGILEDESKLDSFLEDLVKYLKLWVSNHITIQDMDYKPYIRRVL